MVITILNKLGKILLKILLQSRVEQLIQTPHFRAIAALLICLQMPSILVLDLFFFPSNKKHSGLELWFIPMLKYLTQTKEHLAGTVN